MLGSPKYGYGKMYRGMLRAHPIHQPHSRNKEGTHTLGISLSHNVKHGGRKVNSKAYPRALNLGRECKRRVHHQVKDWKK